MSITIDDDTYNHYKKIIDGLPDTQQPLGKNNEYSAAGKSIIDTYGNGKLMSVENKKSDLDLSDMKYDGDDLTEVKIGETPYENKGEYVKGESKEPGIYKTEKGNYIIVIDENTQVGIKGLNDKGVTKIINRQYNKETKKYDKVNSFAIDENNKPLFTVVYNDSSQNGKTVKYFANDKKIRVYGEDENGKFQSEDYKYENNERGNRISTQTYGKGGIKKATFYKEDGTTPESKALYGTENGKRTKTVTDSSGNSTKYIWNTEESKWEKAEESGAQNETPASETPLATTPDELEGDVKEVYDSFITALNTDKENAELDVENLDGRQLAELFNALANTENINNLLPADGLDFKGTDKDAIEAAIEKMVLAWHNDNFDIYKLMKAVDNLKDLDYRPKTKNSNGSTGITDEKWYREIMNEFIDRLREQAQ